MSKRSVQVKRMYRNRPGSMEKMGLKDWVRQHNGANLLVVQSWAKHKRVVAMPF